MSNNTEEINYLKQFFSSVYIKSNNTWKETPWFVRNVDLGDCNITASEKLETIEKLDLKLSTGPDNIPQTVDSCYHIYYKTFSQNRF